METLAYFTSSFTKPADRLKKNNEESSYDSRRMDYYRKSPHEQSDGYGDPDGGLQESTQKFTDLANGEKPFQCISCKRGPPHIKKYAKNQCQTCYKKDKKFQKGEDIGPAYYPAPSGYSVNLGYGAPDPENFNRDYY